MNYAQRCAVAVALAVSAHVAGAAPVQPYVLAYSVEGTVASEMGVVRGKLAAAGFEVLGQYSPYPGASVIGVTSAELKSMGAKTALGGFGAIEHVSLTAAGNQVQVSYLNPLYLAAAYQLDGDGADTAAALKAALGAEKTFGTEKGREPADLRKFNYMVGMEHFEDHYKLASHKSYADAVKAVEDNLAKRVGGASLVYRLDIPGKEQTIFGVSRANVTDQRANDKHIMFEVVDQSFATKTTAYLPYQIMVNGKETLALHMRFRMAVWHPDLTMITFGKLMSSPGAIEDLLAKVAGRDQKQFRGF